MLNCWVNNWSKKCLHLHVKAKVLLLFKEEIQHKLPDKVGVQRVFNDFCPTELEKCRERPLMMLLRPVNDALTPASQQQLLNKINVRQYLWQRHGWVRFYIRTHLSPLFGPGALHVQHHHWKTKQNQSRIYTPTLLILSQLTHKENQWESAFQRLKMKIIWISDVLWQAQCSV